jgi:hypothetical protein
VPKAGRAFYVPTTLLRRLRTVPSLPDFITKISPKLHHPICTQQNNCCNVTWTLLAWKADFDPLDPLDPPQSGGHRISSFHRISPILPKGSDWAPRGLVDTAMIIDANAFM